MEFGELFRGLLAAAVVFASMSGVYEIKKSLRSSGGCRVRFDV